MPGPLNLGLAGGMGAGAAVDSLRAVLERQFRANIEKRIAEENAKQLAENARQFDTMMPLRERGVAVDEGNLGVRRDEFKAGRSDVAAENQASMAQKADIERIISALPPDQQNAARLQLYKIDPTKIQPAGVEVPNTDYGRYLGRYAKSLGVTFDKLTPEQELQARKAFGQSDDRPQQPFIIFPGPTGPLQVNRGTGTATPVVDPQGNPIGATPPAAVKTQLAEEQAGLDLIAEIETLYNDDYIGPVAGRLQKIRQKLPDIGLDEIPPELARFHSAVAGMKNDIIKLITGAAVGVQEEGRIMAAVPDVTDRPEVFKAKMEQTKKNRQNLILRIKGQFAPPPGNQTTLPLSPGRVGGPGGLNVPGAALPPGWIKR